jgi:mitochondrial intermediate peptidase
MFTQNVRLSLKRMQRIPPSSKRRSLATSVNANSNDLLSFFDHPHHRTSWSKSPTGLFGQPPLVSPSSFHNLSIATLIRAQLLTERIVRARQSRDELRRVVKNLDRLSDMLCSVIDLAELVRNAHPDPEWVDSANAAYERLCEYMNVLNTHVGLYEVRLIPPPLPDHHSKASYDTLENPCSLNFLSLSDSPRRSIGPVNIPYPQPRGTPNRSDILARL